MFITMPQLGETVTEGTIVTWYKAVGDDIAEDEALFEVSTDKVDTEVPSAVAGVITEILVREGETVPVGAQLAVVRTAGSELDEPGGTVVDQEVSDQEVVDQDDLDQPADQPADAARDVIAPAPVAAPPPQPVAVRTESSVAPGASVTRADVVARLAARDQPLARPAPARTSTASVTAGVGDTVEPFSSIRRRTGEHLRASIETAAHTLVVMQADYTQVEHARTAVQDDFRAREGFGLSYLPFVARAVVDAIADYPRVNASVGPDALIVHPDVHLGIAVDLDFEGLVVPVVRDPAQLRLVALARAVHDISAIAHAGTLTPDDVTGATFTITNAGGYGTLLTAPIISQPQVAIVSTDGVAMRPVAVATGSGHGLAVHPVGNLSLSFDHRAFDGAYASAFLRRVVEILETRRWTEELA